LQEHAKEVNELLQQKAYFYVCGDAANMAREVNTVLGKIMATERGISESKAEDIVKSMRSANQYQVCFHVPTFLLDSWGLVMWGYPHILHFPLTPSISRVKQILTQYAGGCMVIEQTTIKREASWKLV
jgi:hypothetical protein